MNNFKKFEKFWIKESKSLKWHNEPKKSLRKKNNFNYSWFEDGKLSVFENIFNNSKRKKNAIIFFDLKGNETKITYEELNNAIDNFLFFLDKNFNKTKRIMIHASASIETSVCMLACAIYGIEFTVLFEELEKEAIEIRYKLFKPDIIITRSNDNIIKKKFSKYLKNKKRILRISAKAETSKFAKYKLNFQKEHKENKNKILKGNNPFFVLFTSGSTGEPKGIQHSLSGYLLYAKLTCKKKFGLNKDSIMLTASDAGWINGHTYALFGPLLNDATTIILEKPTLILNKRILKKNIQTHKVNVLYLPVTIIRILKSLYPRIKFKKNFLKCIGSMGEPLAPGVAKWFRNIFNPKKLNIINTYFQTETGGIIYSTSFDDKYKNYEDGSCGYGLNRYVKLSQSSSKNFELKLKYLWPGCMSGVLNSKNIFKNYWDDMGYFKLFDVGYISKKGNLFVNGRIDDVINIRGHRIGSGEIESIILKNTAVKEASVIEIPDELSGFEIILFLSLKVKCNTNIVEKNINKMIMNYFGSYAIPKQIFFIKDLPKTRSGKILRRLLREIYTNPNKKIKGDTSTILNEKILEEIRTNVMVNKN